MRVLQCFLLPIIFVLSFNKISDVHKFDLLAEETYSTGCSIKLNNAIYQLSNGKQYYLKELEDDRGFHLYSRNGRLESCPFKWNFSERGDDYLALKGIEHCIDYILLFEKCGMFECNNKNEVVFTKMILLKRDIIEFVAELQCYL